jgi:hypothetical protein
VSTPPVPEPDDKDWTWVIREPCGQCGYDARDVRLADVPDLTRRYAATLRAAATAPGGTERPAPTTWAAVEYACHVRDVCALFDYRLHLMLDEDDPLFDDWDQDETALAERYWEQDPRELDEQLAGNAELIARSFAAVRADQWDRPGRRSNGSVFTVDTFARYFLHDLAHHAWDVTGKPQPAR